MIKTNRNRRYRYPGNKEAPEWIKSLDSEIIFLKEIYEDNYLCLKTPAEYVYIRRRLYYKRPGRIGLLR